MVTFGRISQRMKRQAIFGALMLLFFLVGPIGLLGSTLYSSPPRTDGASLFLTPSSGSYKSGDPFTLEVRLNTHGEKVVALTAHLSYDQSRLQVMNIDTSGSALSIKAEEVVSGNLIKISRGQPTPGVTGSNILVGKVVFKAKASGKAHADFVLISPGKGPSRIILDDGKGTDILKAVSGGRYSIK